MILNETCILIVDDNADNLYLLNADIQQLGYTVCKAQSGEVAYQQIKQKQFSLIILDVEMPGESGFDLFSRIRQLPNYEDVPILFLSANRIKQKDVIEGLKRGAFDYIVKPYDVEALGCRIQLLVELFNRGRQLQFRNQQLMELSIRDPLTNLYNRRFGLESLTNEMIRHSRYGGYLSVLLVDLDDFKNINDRFGHNAGDEVLLHVSHLLLKCTRETDTCFRAGGDEFIVILPNADATACEQICQRIFNNLFSFHLKDGSEIHMSLSVGGAVFKTAQNDIAHLIESADVAMLNAKSSGKNRYRIVNESNLINQAQTSLLNITEVRTSIKLVLINTLYEVLNEFEIVNDVINGHTELMIEILQKICPKLKIKKYDEVILINATKLRRFEHLAVSKELLSTMGPLNCEQKLVLAEALLENMTKLKKISFFDDEVEVLLHHHEYWNGTGYPHGKERNDIPYSSKLLAVVEAFVVIALGGPHTDSFGFQKALDEIKNESRTHFDPDIVDFFVDYIANSYLISRDRENAKVLIVDDQVEITTAIKRYLAFYGFSQIYVANDLASVRQQLKENTLDLIVSDISLPGTQKLSVLDEIRSLQPMVGLIVVSSGHSALAWSQKEKYNISYSFRKPVNLHVLYNAIKETLMIQKKSSSSVKES